jgi:hypothetical protein
MREVYASVKDTQKRQAVATDKRECFYFCLAAVIFVAGYIVLAI